MAKYNKTTIETDSQSLINNGDFKSEKELKEYIILNKEVFCREVLGFEYKDHIVEFVLPKVKDLFTNEPHVDIVFIDKYDKCYFIELKNPKFAYNELCAGLGQCLTYRYLARANNLNYEGCFLITTKHANIMPVIIRDSNLDVNYIYFDKSKHAVFQTQL